MQAEQGSRDRACNAVCSGPSGRPLFSPRVVFSGLEPPTGAHPPWTRLPQPQEVDSGGPPCAPVTCIWSWGSTQTRVGKVGKGGPALVSRNHATLARDFPGALRQPGSGGRQLPLSRLAPLGWCSLLVSKDRTQEGSRHSASRYRQKKCPTRLRVRTRKGAVGDRPPVTSGLNRLAGEPRTQQVLVPRTSAGAGRTVKGRGHGPQASAAGSSIKQQTLL